MTQVVMPPHANHMGNTFGGQIMEWCEECALLSARKFVKATNSLNYQKIRGLVALPGTTNEISNPMTATTTTSIILRTIEVSSISFVNPSTVGDRIILRGQVHRTFGSFMEVGKIRRSG